MSREGHESPELVCHICLKEFEREDKWYHHARRCAKRERARSRSPSGSE